MYWIIEEVDKRLVYAPIICAIYIMAQWVSDLQYSDIILFVDGDEFYHCLFSLKIQCRLTMTDNLSNLFPILFSCWCYGICIFTTRVVLALVSKGCAHRVNLIVSHGLTENWLNVQFNYKQRDDAKDLSLVPLCMRNLLDSEDVHLQLHLVMKQKQTLAVLDGVLQISRSRQLQALRVIALSMCVTLCDGWVGM